MSNEAATILNEIQFRTGKTLEQIADDIGYSRPYLNNVKLKGGGEKIIGILKQKYAYILQNVSRENGSSESEKDRIIRLQEQNIQDLRDQIELLKSMLKK